ncbi:hypothetical protein ACIQFU_09805 [Streptomyces sp. NPDC093065]
MPPVPPPGVIRRVRADTMGGMRPMLLTDVERAVRGSRSAGT